MAYRNITTSLALPYIWRAFLLFIFMGANALMKAIC